MNRREHGTYGMGETGWNSSDGRVGAWSPGPVGTGRLPGV